MRSQQRPRGCGPLGCFGLICVLLGVCAGSLLPEGARGWIVAKMPVRLSRFAGTPSPVPSSPTPTPPVLTQVPTPTPAPDKPLPDRSVIPPKSREVARLYNGIRVRSALEAEPGRLASLERETPDSYAQDLRFQIKVPEAGKTAADLAHTAPGLVTLLPKMPALLEKAAVSKFYYGIYQSKTDLLRQNLTRLDALLAADTFYDTETILELQDPDSKRRVLLIQTDMDVDTDGSDADRLNQIDPAAAAAPDFQPLTSYKWLKKSAVPSVLLPSYHDRLAKLEADAKAPSHRPGAAQAAEAMRNTIYQVEHYSSLIARTDPFIVLPGFMARQNGHPYQPHAGDYAVVVAGDKLFPAVFGDVGPNYKLGEASLRLAQAVDPRATGQRSPVDDLKITYLVFPGSADGPPAPPDLGKMRLRCQALLNEIGGNSAPLHEWENLIPPPPTPTPALSPSTSPSASPVPSPPVALALSPTPVTSPSAPPASTPPGASVSPPSPAPVAAILSATASPSPSVSSIPVPKPTASPAHR